MLVDFDGQPLWVASADLGQTKGDVRFARVLMITLPAKDGAGEAGWIATVQELKCSSGRSRIATVLSGAMEGRTIAVPSWYQPSRKYEMVLPHTRQVTAMHAVCDGLDSGQRITVTGSPEDVYAYQAKLRKERLGF